MNARASTNTFDAGRSGSLVAWQWSVYRGAHRDRRNLVLHALTAPLFIGGSAAVALSPFIGWVGLLGLAAMAAAVGLQGFGHRFEPEPPAPFRSRLDFAARLFSEQWVTFPRFVLSGGFARAWRAAGRPRTTRAD